MVATGLRGVGKTVLLNALEDISVERGWIAVTHELDESSPFPAVIANCTKKALNELKPTKRVAAQVREALGRLGSFSLRDPNGFELTYDPDSKKANHALSEDFVELFLALGQAAESKGRGVAFLLDEAQFIPSREFGHFAMGLHRLNQRALPVTCVAAGPD